MVDKTLVFKLAVVIHSDLLAASRGLLAGRLGQAGFFQQGDRDILDFLEARVAAFAWDESIGRLLVAEEGTSQVVVYDFAAAPRQGECCGLSLWLVRTMANWMTRSQTGRASVSPFPCGRFPTLMFL